MISIALTGCSHSFYDDGDYFHIENDGAVMPVWIRGDQSSQTFVIYVHGGPGNSAVAEGTLEQFSDIETEASLVYWDQRGSGLSDGNPQEITNELIAEDLDILVDVLIQEYDAEDVVLMGHSYGGVTTSCYLSEPQRRDKIAGWIVIDGIHNLRENWRYSVEWAVRKIEVSGNEDHWRETLDWYEELALGYRFQSHEEIKRHLHNVDSLGGMYLNDDDRAGANGEMIFLSPIGLGMLENEQNCGPRIDRWWESDYSDSLSSIDVPLLLLTGVHDGVFPQESCRMLFDGVGTESSEKEWILFDSSAHHPHFEENDLFNREVIRFLERL